MSTVLFWLGALIALGAAVVFAALGATALYAGWRSTGEQLVPGFRPDRPGPVARGMTLVGVWVPLLGVAMFGIYAAVRLVQVVLAAI